MLRSTVTTLTPRSRLINTTTPEKPTSSPARRVDVIRSSESQKCAMTMVNRGTVAFRMAARPESIGERGIGLGGAIDITDRIRAQERLQQVQADFAHAARLSDTGL